MLRVSILTVLVALAAPAIPVAANAASDPGIQCFTNSAEGEYLFGCYNIGEGATTATIHAVGGKYIVSCNGGYTCSFTFVPDRPGPGYPKEP